MATIRYLPDVADRADLVGAVEAAGYDVRDRAPSAHRTRHRLASSTELSADDLASRAREARTLLVQAVVSIAVALGDHGR